MKRQIPKLLWFIVTAALVVGVWRAWVVVHKNAYLQAMASEVGSVAELRYPYVVPNHSGTRMMLAMDTENGPGILFCEIPNGKKKWLYEADQQSYVWAHYKIFGWSPDDKLLVYGHQSVPKQKPDETIPGDLFIADGNTGETLAKIRVATDQTNTVSQFAWLSTKSFAFLNAEQDLFVYEQKPGGWAQTRLFTNATGGNMFEAQSFTALSADSVSWRMREAIWKFDLLTGSSVNQWGLITNNFNTNRLISSSYSTNSGKYLVVCYSRKDRQALYIFDPNERSLTKITRIKQGMTPDVPPTWINHDKGFVFLSPEMDMFSLMIVSNMFDSKTLAINMSDTNAFASPVELLRRGEARRFSVMDDHIFVAGVLSNEPPGIWEYSVTSGALSSLLSSATAGLQHTECAPFEFKMFTNSAKIQILYHIWTPAHFSPDKQYPLIIGNTPYSWTPFPMAAANAGYFFVTIDRPSWLDDSMGDWAEKVMAVYQRLAENPNIDTNQVYLYARCIETKGLSELALAKPGMWKGALIFDGESLPDISNPEPFKHIRIMMAAGKLEDPAMLKSLRNFQQRASDVGMNVRLVLLDNSPHISYGVAVQRQRVQEMVKFLTE